VRRRRSAVRLGRVYRTRRLLVAEGLADEIPGPPARFDANLAAHHHFTCLRCGCILDVDGPLAEPHAAALRGRVAARTGLAITHHRIEFFGRCPRCRSSRSRRAPARRAPCAPSHAAVPRIPTGGMIMAGKSLRGTKSHDNLKEAFAGESQANRRYLYFARVADIEGFPDMAGLFKDTADAETGHAFGHMDFLKEVGDPATGEPFGKT